MKRAICFSLLSLAWATAPQAFAYDPCSRIALMTAAEVSVSDGTRYQTESYFAARDAAAIHFIDEGERTIVVEGDHAWGRVNGNAQMGADFHKLFALGHQYHAFLRFFDLIVIEPRDGDVEWQDQQWDARIGDYPYGGQVSVLRTKDKERPAALIFDFAQPGRISARLLDWRQQGDVWLPFHIQIDDGERVFDYRYTRIDLAERAPGWFLDQFGESGLEAIEAQRARYRELLPRCR